MRFLPFALGAPLAALALTGCVESHTRDVLGETGAWELTLVHEDAVELTWAGNRTQLVIAPDGELYAVHAWDRGGELLDMTHTATRLEPGGAMRVDVLDVAETSDLHLTLAPDGRARGLAVSRSENVVALVTPLSGGGWASRPLAIEGSYQRGRITTEGESLYAMLVTSSAWPSGELWRIEDDGSAERLTTSGTDTGQDFYAVWPASRYSAVPVLAVDRNITRDGEPARTTYRVSVFDATTETWTGPQVMLEAEHAIVCGPFVHRGQPCLMSFETGGLAIACASELGAPLTFVDAPDVLRGSSCPVAVTLPDGRLAVAAGGDFGAPHAFVRSEDGRWIDEPITDERAAGLDLAVAPDGALWASFVGCVGGQCGAWLAHRPVTLARSPATLAP